MTKDTQISAYVSDATKQRLDMFVRETGVKKARVIEDALNAHLDALAELPADAIIPTRIVLTANRGSGSWSACLPNRSPPRPFGECFGSSGDHPVPSTL